MKIEDLNKHFDHIISNTDKLESKDIVEYLTTMSEKINIPLEDVVESFVLHWEKVNDKLKTK